MRFNKTTVIGLLWLTLPVLAQEDLAGVDEMMEQLPAELEDKLVDPLTVEKNISFAGGESLKFKLGWGIFSVAKASLQTSP